MAASLHQLEEVLRRAKHPNPITVAAKIFEQVHQPYLQADAVTTRTKARLMLVLVSQLLPLIEQIAQYDKEIGTLFFLGWQTGLEEDVLKSRQVGSGILAKAQLLATPFPSGGQLVTHRIPRLRIFQGQCTR